ncbi:hypothetical protein [Arthrobacter agilis]|uniref:hypothetical protein n=1 Tax=Arthrobacter agilis TaxID=37921 RepID=UPI001ABFEF81|nr:hypothetical protein [Arthrobacter agilis]
MHKSKRSAVVIVAAAVVNFILFALTGAEFSDETWGHLWGWARDFSTGAPMAGLFAIGASFVALHGINKQVKATRTANDLTEESVKNAQAANIETAEKNRQSQWWDTLKWTYTEAKASSDGSASPLQSGAAARILGALKAEPNLKPLQDQAADSILKIFGQSDQAEVQEAVRPIYEAMDSVAPAVYADAVENMLEHIELSVEVYRHREYAVSVAGENHVFDFVLEAITGKKVAVNVQTFTPSDYPKASYSEHRGGSYRQDQLASFVKEDVQNRAALYVMSPPSRGPGDVGFWGVVEGLKKRDEVGLSTVIWGIGTPTDEIEAFLQRKLKAT